VEIVYGNVLADKLKARMKQNIDDIRAKGARLPLLCVILVGDNPASQSYVRGKEKACHQIGMLQKTIRLDGNITQDELSKTIIAQNLDPLVDGILVQMPLPSHLDENAAIDLIDPQKDVDGLHPMNAGALLTNRAGFIPCTPEGCMAILDEIGYKDLAGKKAVVCGRSNLVGKPVGLLLQKRNATVTTVHSKTPDIEQIASSADILIVAMGQPKLVTESWVKEGAVVIDVGINRVDGKLVGDCDFESISKKAAYATPVPKGVGPMTVCMLLQNTLEAYKHHMQGE
jgi:methylenetetrahydrofolate dehydrogenase (NADP+) / methenyltetrahydrofolate cyclohydrolase